MGVDARLETAGGTVQDEIEDRDNTFSRFINENFNLLGPILRSIDIYADTTFRSNEMGGLMDELREIQSAAYATSEQRDQIGRVLNLAARCKGDADSKLVFLGD